MKHTKAIHAGFDPADHRGAVSVPIYQSSTFAFPSAEEGAERFAGRSDGPIYTRLGNPMNQALEEAVASPENGCGDGITAGLMRLSVGCEDLDDIRADLAQATRVTVDHSLFANCE